MSIDGKYPSDPVRIVDGGVELLQFDSDGNQNPVGDDNPLHVTISSQDTRVFNNFLAQDLDALTYSLNVDAVAGATTLQIVVDGTHPTGSINAGETLFVFDGFGAEQLEVISVTAQVGYDDVVIDSPLPKTYAAATPTEIKRTTINFAKAGGSLGSHLEFVMPPPLAQSTPVVLDITFMKIILLDDVAMDDGKFGGIAALTNGIVLHHHRPDGINSIFNAKTNGDLKHIGRGAYDDRSGGGGDYGFGVEILWEDWYGVPLRIYPGDYVEILVQDDLSALTRATCTVGGQVTTQTAP